MTSAELFKIRTQRTPLVCALTLLAGVLIPSIVMIWYTPSDPAAYEEGFEGTFQILTILLGIVFGGWLLGSEYRQGTVKRMLTSEPRRLRALVTKAVIGLSAMAIVTTVAALVGWAAARYVGSINDVTVSWDGRTLLAGGVTALFGALLAYGLSVVTRSDSFAMVGSVVLLLVFEPLFSLIPKIGKYRLGGALTRIEETVSGSQGMTLDSISLGAAGLTVAAWIGTVAIAGALLFRTRDV